MKRVRHVKRGSTYLVLGEAEIQISKGKGLRGNFAQIKEGDRLVIYQGEDGKLWARFPDDFKDGRFEEFK
jgi:hypothetical protein